MALLHIPNLQFVLLSENTAGAFWMVRSRLYQRELPAGTVLEWLDGPDRGSVTERGREAGGI